MVTFKDFEDWAHKKHYSGPIIDALLVLAKFADEYSSMYIEEDQSDSFADAVCNIKMDAQRILDEAYSKLQNISRVKK